MAAPRYMIVGQKQVALVSHDNEEQQHHVVHSPEWMVSLDKILFSTITKYSGFCELRGWYAEMGRLTQGDVSNQLFTSASLKHSDVIIVIPAGGYAAQLQSHMNLGSLIKAMHIIYLGNVGKEKVKLQEIIHSDCRIQRFEQRLNDLVIHLQVSSKTDTHFIYNREGHKKGQMVTAVHYGQGDVFDKKPKASKHSKSKKKAKKKHSADDD